MAKKKKDLISKRINKYVYDDQGNTTTYTYRAKSQRSPLLFNRRGSRYTLNQKNWDAFMESIEKSDMPIDDKVTLTAELNREKNAILKGGVLTDEGAYGSIYSSQAQHGYNRIDVDSMLSRVNDSKIKRMLINLGFDESELAETFNEELDDTDFTITEADIMNKENWRKNEDGEHIFEINYGRRTFTWVYEFKYNDTVFVRKR